VNAAPVSDHEAYFRFRDDLLGPSRTRVLTAAELCEAGRLVYGDPNGLSLYGIPAPEMEAKGIRLLGRTTIECSVDAHAGAAARAVAAAHATFPAVEDAMIVDLFCGSGNLGHHLGERLGHPVYASELDPVVYAATRNNLDRIGSTIDLYLTDYRDLIAQLPAIGPNDTYAIEPPWGSALTTAGLDLTRTTPPVPEILADIRRVRAGQPCVVVIKTNDKIAHDSLGATFRAATHVRTVPADRILPHGANMDYHVYRVAD
jgi:16S rRNA G966 N2-methylase RsmD